MKKCKTVEKPFTQNLVSIRRKRVRCYVLSICSRYANCQRQMLSIGSAHLSHVHTHVRSFHYDNLRTFVQRISTCMRNYIEHRLQFHMRIFRVHSFNIFRPFKYVDVNFYPANKKIYKRIRNMQCMRTLFISR